MEKVVHILTVKIVEITKEETLKDVGDLKLKEGFLPLVGDSIRYKGSQQYKVVERHFWLDDFEERINLYVKSLGE